MRDPSTYRSARRNLARHKLSQNDVMSFGERFHTLSDATSVKRIRERDRRRYADKVVKANADHAAAITEARKHDSSTWDHTDANQAAA